MEFKIDTLPQDFNSSIKSMEKRVDSIINQTEDEMAAAIEERRSPTSPTEEIRTHPLDLGRSAALSQKRFEELATSMFGNPVYHICR